MTFILLNSCLYVTPSPTPAVSKFDPPPHHGQRKSQESYQYQQQRRRLQRQLAQQPASYCLEIWDDTTVPCEQDLNNICVNENWSLLDFTKRRDHASLIASSFINSIDSNIDKDSNIDANVQEYVGHGVQSPQRKLTNHLNNPLFSWGQWKNTCFQRWMTLLRRRLSTARLGDLVIPGTHNSASFSVSPNGTLVEKLWISRVALSLGFSNYFSSWARNHDDGLGAQLNAGYRCLDLRIALLPNGGFYWWHGISGEAIESGLKEIANFATENPGEIIILLISHLNAPGNGIQEKLPMPGESKIKLGKYLLSILGPNLVPTRNISLNPTLSSVISTRRNVIALIREDKDLVNAFPDYFWSDVNNETAVEMFERRTNPRSMFTHRSDIMQKYKRNFPDRLAITPAFVTHNVPNVLGGILRSKRVAWALSLFLTIMFYRLIQSSENRNITKFFCTGLKRRSPVKAAKVTVICIMIIMISVYLGHLQHRTILRLFGFEGKASNLLEMARIANLCGDDPSKANGEIMYKGINTMIRHWSDREQEYRLNIVLVDDFSSSQAVRTAIQENIRRTDVDRYNTKTKLS
ncbi:PI-PLC X domain-containing protein 1-like [Octopus vulgaris]|uniref:PI-PLC X domain-containing protein 1-like n=1 Tax=Octopus vulgaris TaxID=6645 RepID=A0AA36BBN3_OCTVU|nr:PI-PLC X domain-containing protein 1-like [Octopus vulgaris]